MDVLDTPGVPLATGLNAVYRIGVAHMNISLRRLAVLACFVGALPNGPVQAQDTVGHTPPAWPQPALAPGEVLMETANGCYVITTSKVLATRRAFYPGFGAETWSGACPSGLASGKGTFGESKYFYEMKNGRYLNTTTVRSAYSQEDFMTILDLDGEYVAFSNQGDPYAPNWDVFESNWLAAPGRLSVRTISRSCMVGIAGLPRYEAFERDCSMGYGTGVARGVQVGDPGYPDSLVTTWCSMKYTMKKKPCEQAWARLAGPIIDQVKAFRARHPAVVADILQQSGPLAADWEAQWPAAQAARQAARMTAAVQSAQTARDLLASLRQAAEVEAEAQRKAALAEEAEEQRRLAAEKDLPPPRFRSVCMRNFKKMENALYGNMTAAATYDLWLINIAEDGLRILEPCAASDPDAAYQVARGREQIQKIRQYCSGPHHQTDCLPWGYQGVVADGRDRRALAETYTRLWHAEAIKAQSDPNYSADLGRAGGPRPKTTGAYAEHEQCRVAMQQLGDRMERADKALPDSDIVRRSELILWYTMEAQAAIARTCPNSPSYRKDSQEFQATYENVLHTCNQIASSGCSAKPPEA
jgi:hypothetical protein